MKCKVEKNTEQTLVLYFQPGDGTAYMVHLMPDINGGVLLASTYGSKGLYRWNPLEEEVKIISAEHGPWFANHFHDWMNHIYINSGDGNRSVRELVLWRWFE